MSDFDMYEMPYRLGLVRLTPSKTPMELAAGRQRHLDHNVRLNRAMQNCRPDTGAACHYRGQLGGLFDWPYG